MKLQKASQRKHKTDGDSFEKHMSLYIPMLLDAYLILCDQVAAPKRTLGKHAATGTDNRRLQQNLGGGSRR